MGRTVDLSSLAQSPVGVLGLGRTGLSAAKALVRSGIDVRAWDDSTVARSAAAATGIDVPDQLEGFCNGLTQLVLSPGVPHTWPAPHPIVAAARAAGTEIIGDVELLMRACPDAKYIGITGTNGKSTTTALIGHMLGGDAAVEVGGNIGTPALDLAPLGAEGTYVLELSSYQLELVPTGVFDTAVLLNISPDHTERHGNVDGYVNAKARIFSGQDNDGTAVIGVDDATCRGLFDRLFQQRAGRVIAISGQQAVRGGIYAEAGWLIDDRGGQAKRVLGLTELRTLPGQHNAQNLAAAFAASTSADATPSEVAARVPSFPGLPHRQEAVGRVDGVLFVNDSKATNLAAVTNALSCYDNIVWIAGGRPKEALNIAPVADLLRQVVAACVIGEAGPTLARQLDGRIPVTDCGDLETAVHKAASIASNLGAHATVVLSPGCASFDQFDNFEARGEAFRAFVSALPGAHTPGGKQVAC